MRVAICHARAGSGHLKAAEALAAGFEKFAPDIETSLIDAVELSHPVFRLSYTRIYDWFVHRAPRLWGRLYNASNARGIQGVLKPFRDWNNHLVGGPLERAAVSSPFDVWICTHFFAANVLAGLRRRGKLPGRVVTVITDFRLHAFWVNPGTDAYIVMHRETAEDLRAWGVGDAEILEFGIPVHPRFFAPVDKSRLFRELALDPRRFTLLVSSGTFGTGPLAEILRSAETLGGKIQFLVVCGRNERVYASLSALANTLATPAKIFGFTDRMADLLAASDFAIVKPGGLTTTECLARGVPMILINPIPGQEQGNALFLERHGAAREARTASEVIEILRGWIGNGQDVRAMAEKVRGVSKPRSTEDIVRWVRALS